MRLGQREGPYLELFEQIWGEPRALAPTALDLFNVAHQLGLPASFDVVPSVLAQLRQPRRGGRAGARRPPEPARPAAEPLIGAFLAERLVERGSKLALPVHTPRAGLVFWERDEADCHPERSEG